MEYLVPAKSYNFIKTELTGEKKNVALITLNRPKALNALCNDLMTEISVALDTFENDANVAAGEIYIITKLQNSPINLILYYKLL